LQMLIPLPHIEQETRTGVGSVQKAMMRMTSLRSLPRCCSRAAIGIYHEAAKSSQSLLRENLKWQWVISLGDFSFPSTANKMIDFALQ
jgi:hypothetical protein